MIGLLGFTIVDKDVDPKITGKAVDELLDWIIRDARRREIKQLIYFTDKNSNAIVSRLIEKGGILTESNHVVIPLDYNISTNCIEQC